MSQIIQIEHCYCPYYRDSDPCKMSFVGSLFRSGMSPSRFKVEAMSLFWNFITRPCARHGSHPGLNIFKNRPLNPGDISVDVHWNVPQANLVPTKVEHLTDAQFSDLANVILGCPTGSFWVLITCGRTIIDM